MADILINGTLAPNGTAFPIARATQIAGGRREVADLTARDAIPASVRTVGAEAYTVADGKVWRLVGGILNANWVDVTADAVTFASVNAALATADAPVDWNGQELTGIEAAQYDNGIGAAVAAAGTGKLRYNDVTKRFERSVDGSAWAALTGAITAPAVLEVAGIGESLSPALTLQNLTPAVPGLQQYSPALSVRGQTTFFDWPELLAFYPYVSDTLQAIIAAGATWRCSQSGYMAASEPDWTQADPYPLIVGSRMPDMDPAFRTFLGDWDIGTTYAAGDAVYHGGDYFYASAPTTGNAPVPPDGQYAPGVTYQVGDRVFVDGTGIVYEANQITTGNAPPGAQWDPLPFWNWHFGAAWTVESLATSYDAAIHLYGAGEATSATQHLWLHFDDEKEGNAPDTFLRMRRTAGTTGGAYFDKISDVYATLEPTVTLVGHTNSPALHLQAEPGAAGWSMLSRSWGTGGTIEAVGLGTYEWGWGNASASFRVDDSGVYGVYNDPYSFTAYAMDLMPAPNNDRNFMRWRMWNAISAASNALRIEDSAAALLFAISSTGVPQWSAANAQLTVGAAGAAAALPASPSAFFKVKDSSGNEFVIPAYATS